MISKGLDGALSSRFSPVSDSLNSRETGSDHARPDASADEIASGPSAVTVDGRTFREALARFASGVCVVTTVTEDETPLGVTISAFCSLSLEPPLVLFCIGKRSANLGAWLSGDRFSVNVLREDQAFVSEIFAAQNEDKFDRVRGSAGVNGCFRIDGCLVTLECRHIRTHDDGDHHILIGLIERAVFGDVEAQPLLRFRAAYGRLG